MFGAVIGWARNLSIVGKVALGTATIGTVGVVSTSAILAAQPQNVTSNSQVQAKEPVITTEEVQETRDIVFEKQTEDNPLLDSGKTELKQAGVNGVETITYKITYSDGKETSKELISQEVTTEPVNEITYIGTNVSPKYIAPVAPERSCDPNYSGGCVPNVDCDLDCADIGFSVTVIGYDKHRFDRDRDGYGCESY